MNRPTDVRVTDLPAEQRFQLLVDSITDYAIFLLTPEGNVNSWNTGAERLKGYLVDEIIGRHFSCFYSAADQAAGVPARALHTALTEGKFQSEGWRIRKDGSRFWASVVIDTVHDDAGNLVGFAKITRDITERMLAQEKLRESEERFRMLVNGVIDYAIYMISPEGIITNWNAGAQRIKGYSADEVVGSHYSRFFTETDRSAGKPMAALAIASREGRFEAEGQRLRKDGSLFWAHVVLDAVRNDQGELIGFVKITRDITERRKAAEALERAHDATLRAQTERYENLMRLFEQAPGFICFFRGPEHVYELQNDAHWRLAEYKDIIGKPVRAALPELEGQGFFELLDRVFATGEPYNGRAQPLLVKPASGAPAETRYIDFVYQPIIDPEGRIIGIVSQGSDVTEQVLAQQAVREKQRELESLIAERTRALEETQEALKLARQLQVDKRHLLQLFDQAPGFIAVTREPEHVFELANKAYYQLVGQRELIGKPAQQALPELSGQGFFELLDKVYASGKPFVGYDIAIAVGTPPETKYIDFVYQPIYDDSGKPSGIFVQGSDVTQRKLAQDEVRRYQSDLETLVFERTRALEETRAALLQSQKLESIGKLTGGVAHDFNNVLQIVGGNLQLLDARLGADRDAARHLETAISAVERGARLSSQLLAFARRQPLQPVAAHLGRVVQSMDALLRQALGGEVELETIVAGGLWNVQIDTHLLENAILNLAINASDAMDARGRLTVELGNAMLDDDYALANPDVNPGQYVMLAVSDTGSGMTPEVLERAIEPFFTTKPEDQGTGLGLSMVYGFVKQSGGHLKIYSEPGHGTTVKMYFPRSMEAETLPGLRAPAPGPVQGGSETILVVEDDLAVQATVVEILGDLGYRVLRANNADEALAILKSGIFIDLLFTDVVMPGQLRSPELARQARLLIPGVEVLFTSGYTQNAIVHGGRLDPGVHLLSKPYRREQLARKVRQLLESGKRAQVPAPASSPEPAAEPAPEPAAALAVADQPEGARKILVVEDNEDGRTLICELLSLIGHAPQGAESAEEALKLLRGEPFDVLLTDYSLPGMSGLELARTARAELPRLHIIFASGYGEAIEGARELDCQMLSKPFDLAQLEQALKTF